MLLDQSASFCVVFDAVYKNQVIPDVFKKFKGGLVELFF